MQNSNVCQVTAGSGAIPQRKRYAPYGASRQTTPVTFPNTDRGFLNQPHDTNGLVYLNNRYHDPQLGAFISVDPLVGQTGMPYLYGDGSPVTLSDPSGLCAADVYGARERCSQAKAKAHAASAAAGTSGSELVGTLCDGSCSVDSNLESNIDIESPLFNLFGQTDAMYNLWTGCAWSDAYCKLLDQLIAGAPIADVIAVLSLMPSGFAPWIYGGQDKLLLEHDRMMAEAGLQAGMFIRLLRDSGLGAPEYLVIDVDLLVGPGLAIGGGGLLIYSRSGQIFNGAQLNVGSAGLTMGLRAGWLRTDERATAEEVDAFLVGPAVSASVSVVASATYVANFSGSSWEVGLSSSVGINLSLAWVAESAAKSSGWDV